MDVYTYEDGLCQLNATGLPMTKGALEGDEYCQMFLNVEMGTCSGCPGYQRRLEIYSNRDTGCGLEFYREETNEEGEEEETDDSTTDNTDGDDSTTDPEPTPGPIIEEGASKIAMGSAFLAASLLALN